MCRTPNRKLHIIPIVLVALLVRLAIVWVTLHSHSANWFFAQATELAQLAESLRTGHGLSSPFGCCTGPSAFLGPGYPAVIATFFAVFQPYSSTSFLAIMIFQALCGSATVFALMLLTRRAFGASAANAAGVVWALSPPAIYLPTLFWETSLSICLATVLILLALDCADKPSLRQWLIASLVAALATAVNPSLLPLIVCCFGWAFYHTRPQSTLAPACALILLVLLCAPWAIRNVQQLHAFIPLRSNLGYELWQGNRPGSDGFFSPSLHPNTSLPEFSRYQTLGEVSYMREKGKIAMDAIRENPERFLVLTGKRTADFWTGVGQHSAGLIVAYICLTTLGGCVGLVLLWRKSRKLALFFFLPILIFPLPYYITHPDFRFRLVLDPIMVALAAYALTLNSNKEGSLLDL